jgi:malate synthase
VNRTPPQPQLTNEALPISAQELAVIATLCRTYDAQRLRLLARGSATAAAPTLSPLRGLSELEPAISLDGAPVSASIVDAVTQAAKMAGGAVVLPLAAGPPDLAAAEAGWWDALLGDVERRMGLPPRSVAVELDVATSDEARAVFADRILAART